MKSTSYPTRLIDLWAQWSDKVAELKAKEIQEDLEKKKLNDLKKMRNGEGNGLGVAGHVDGVKTATVESEKKKEKDTDYKPRDPKDRMDYVRLITPQSLLFKKTPASEDDPSAPHSTQNERTFDTIDPTPETVDSAKHSIPQPTPSLGLYITLSHCWGGTIFTRLGKKNLERFQKKIPLNELPRTFREVMHFVRRLNPDIRYIWIDSLCIIQDDTDDWTSESAKMYDVYRNSYCNISATAARNSQEGLYFRRNPHYLWGDEVNINTDGIPKSRTKVDLDQGLGHQPVIRRCDVLDLSFWEREVDKAPVNTRAWVLQERLLHPRVLHFCKNQIAWECRHLDAAERFPHGVPDMTSHVENAEYRPKLKNLIPNPYGRHPISTIPNEVSSAAHENWKLIVERYSKTGLTKPEDKLIALAGIAEMMDGQIKGRYVAGMWEKYLASQLLWRVEPVWKNGLFSFPSSRPQVYRAPSFSWAAIDAPQGVKCAATVKEGDMHIRVVGFEVVNKDNIRFGQIMEQGTHLELSGVLKRIQMSSTEKDRGVFKRVDERGNNARFVWTGLVPDHDPLDYKQKPEEEAKPAPQENNANTEGAEESEAVNSEEKIQYLQQQIKTLKEQIQKQKKPKPDEKSKFKPKVGTIDELWEHDAVYLDSRSDDLEAIEDSKNQLYCMPAYTDSNNSLICLLLLQYQDDILRETRRYRRVGVTFISPYEGGRETILPNDYVKRREESPTIFIV